MPHNEVTEEKLIEVATEALRNAYCPYSNFPVGAALVTESGDVFAGANVENAAYPVGSCAERIAIGNAVTAGHRKFVKIVVTTDLAEPATPCGMCRQAIAEFGANIEVKRKMKLNLRL